MLTLLATSFYLGYFATILTVLEQLIEVYGYTSQQASSMGALAQVGGMTGGIFFSLCITHFAKNSPPYKFVMILIGVMTLLSKCFRV